MRAQRFGPLLLVVFVLGCSLNAYPYGPSSVHYVAVSPDGSYVGFVTLDGDLRVYDLESRRKVFEPPRGKIEGVTPGHAIRFVAFQGQSGRVLWDCAFGKVCWHDLETGEEGTLLEHDPQDNIRHGIVSDDGQRMAFGTAGGRIFTFEPGTGAQRELKPRDVWTVGGADPIYTLEGTPSLGYFVSATSLISGLICGVDFGDRWWVYLDREKGHAKDIKYSGIVVWDYATGEAHAICDGFNDKVRAAFSPTGKSLAVITEDSYPFKIYTVPEFGVAADFPSHHIWGPNGLAYLDLSGRFLGATGYEPQDLEVIDLEDPSYKVTKYGLRHQAAGGSRMMVAHPEKGWVFIGLAGGGVDWSRFQPGDPPTLDHIATLR